MFGNYNYRGAVEIVPSDTVNFARGVCQGIYVGTSGNISVVMEDGTSVIFTAPLFGRILPIRAIRVNATGTGASQLLALY